jgi:REP-associated tyrosine transposase
MSRKLRFVPEPGQLVLVTNRCAEARFFLKPSSELNDRVIGVLGRAQRRCGVEIVLAIVLSSHFHLLVVVKDAKQLAEFMHFVDTNLAKVTSRLLGRIGPFWQDRYHDVLVANQEEDQVAVLRYVLEQGCKEGLVMSPLDWPGVQSTRAILEGQPLRGTWIDRTALYEANRNQGKPPREKDFSTTETLHFSPLPCWKHLSEDGYRARIGDLVDTITAETRKRHRLAGTRPLGARRICRKKPEFKPREAKKSLARQVRTATTEARRLLIEAYRAFVRSFRAAAERLKAHGDLSGFPPGSFPPGGPFVPLLEPG